MDAQVFPLQRSEHVAMVTEVSTLITAQFMFFSPPVALLTCRMQAQLLI